jgi:serine/threonine protein kinase
MLEMLHPYRHPNIVAYLGRSNSSIVMEWVPRTLNDIKSPSKARISKLLLGFVKGMAFVHELGFVHRDLKPSNVLVTKDDVVKIADFGIARELGNPKDMTTGIGTTYFMPNEQRRRASSGYNESVDVHSFGMTCNELINECQWNHPVMTELVKKCAMPKIDLGIRQQAKPQDRPSFQDILLILRQRFEQAKPAVLPNNLGQIKPRSYQRDDPGSDDATASDASGDESEAGDDDTIPDIGGGAAEKLPRVTPGSVSRQSWCPPANECPYCKDYRNGNRLHKACSLRPKAAPKPHNKPALHRKQIVKSLNTKPTECMDNLPRKTSGSSHRQSWCRSDDECRYCKDFQNGNRLRQACALKPPKL